MKSVKNNFTLQSCGPLSEALMHTAIKYPTSQEISQVTETTGEIEFSQ